MSNKAPKPAMPPLRNKVERQCDGLLFAFLWLVFAYFYQGGFSNQASRFDLALSLGFEHQLSIDSWHDNTIDKAEVGGRFYSEKAPLAAYLATPVTLLGSLVWTKDDLKSRPERLDWLHYAATIVTVSLLSAASAVAFRRLLCLVNPSLPLAAAFFWTAVCYLGTPIVVYSTMLFGHQLAGGLVVIGFYLLLESRGQVSAKTRDGAWILGCFVLGLAVFAEYPVAALAVGCFLSGVLFAQPRRAPLALGVAAALLPAVALGIHNQLSFGSPFSLGYGHLQSTIFADQMRRGFFGVTWPRPDAALQLLFGVYRGLFIYAPVLVIACLGWWLGAGRQRYLWPAIAGAGVLLLVNSSYAYWQGGACFGPRHLVPAIGLVGLGLAHVPESLRRSPAVIGLAALSIGINAAGTVVTPFLSEFDRNPLATYARLLRRGLVAINPMAFSTPAADAGARWRDLRAYAQASFNLGELLGLSGPWSLLPLVGLAALITLLITRRLHARLP